MSITTTAPHVDALRTPLTRALPYPAHLRFYDGFLTGRRDADATLAHEPVAGAQPSASLRRLEAALTERCEREFWDATTLAAPLLDRRAEIQRAVVALSAQANALQASLDADGEPSETELARVSATEAHLPAAQVRERRRREAAQRIAPLRANVAAVRGRADALTNECAQIDGKLTTLFDGLTARVRALANLYERRAGTLVRAYLRRTPVSDGHRHPLNTRSTLTPPAWATAPNPWLRTPLQPAVRIDPGGAVAHN